MDVESSMVGLRRAVERMGESWREESDVMRG
jgi:hypothetical protein